MTSPIRQFLVRRAVRKGTRPSNSSDNDSGLILPMALVLTTVLGGVVVAIASYTTASTRYGRAVQDKTDRLAASDAGMRVALEKLRTRTGPTCSSSPSTYYTTTVNSKAVTVSCQRTLMLADEAAPFALVVTAIGVPAGTSSLIAQGTNVASNPRKIGGNIYLNVPPASLDKPVQIKDGDIWYPAMSCPSTDPVYNNLTFVPADERGFNCTTSSWQTILTPTGTTPGPGTEVPPLPAVANGNPKVGGNQNTDGCVVFDPGTYTSPPIIGAGTENFFKPGTYYFNFTGAITIKNATVIGGVSGADGSGSSPVAREPSSLTSTRCQSAINTASAANKAPNYGVTWIFGGNSRISIDPNGLLELFRPPMLTATQKMVPSIVALQSSASGYSANTLGAMGSPLIDMQEGSNDGIVIHGGVWAPTASVMLGNVAQRANGQFMGGLVAAMLNFQAAASAGNLNMSVLTYPATRKYVVSSVADNLTTTKVVATVRASTGSLAINSWRVQ